MSLDEGVGKFQSSQKRLALNRDDVLLIFKQIVRGAGLVQSKVVHGPLRGTCLMSMMKLILSLFSLFRETKYLVILRHET